MERYDWKGKIKTNILVLTLLGLWPKGENTYEPGLYTVYAAFMVIIVAFGHLFFQIINVYNVVHNLKSFAATSYLLPIEIMAAYKAYALIKNVKVLKQWMTVFRSDWFQPRNSEQKKIIEPSLNFWTTVYRMFLTMCLGCDIFWALYPIADKTAFTEKRLPFLGWYPYDVKKSPFYEITYLYQVVGVMFLCTVHLNVDTLITAFYIYTACQIDMLCDDLRHLGDYNRMGKKTDAYQYMLKCIHQHRNILNFAENSNDFYNWILFWHLLISGVSIGITMFQLTQVVPFSGEFYSLVVYGFAIIIQIFMYCWFANEVRAKSENLSYAVFECDWTDLPEDLKKKLLFLMMNLAKPLQISAFNLFTVSLETYMKILKTAWSYFALLHNFESNK